jgi:hypothetical protein
MSGSARFEHGSVTMACQKPAGSVSAHPPPPPPLLLPGQSLPPQPLPVQLTSLAYFGLPPLFVIDSVVPPTATTFGFDAGKLTLRPSQSS